MSKVIDTNSDVAEEVEAMSSRLMSSSSISPKTSDVSKCPFSHSLKLNVVGSTHQTSPETATLLNSIGGSKKLTEMTELFYSRMFADKHLDQFVRNHNDPHAERLADWIAEKMGGEGDIWTQKRLTRPREVVSLYGGQKFVVNDRSSAHYAAWNSPKRSANVVGLHFKLHDSRNWLRLMLWSARDVGLLDNKIFADWYTRFLGHFVRIYASEAPQFVRESARWSESQENIQKYLDAGRYMADVHVPYSTAIQDIPLEERYDRTDWPYEQESP